MLISYAQNLEDVILMRALRNIEQGFYIDVGAAWSEEHSVTKAFYDKGWSGINVEPNAKFLISLIENRPRDLNIGVALGENPTILHMNFFEETGLSTFVDAIAEKNILNGRTAVRQEIEVTTLKFLWEKYIPPEQDVHFLKIDVEGFEKAVLTGNNWQKNRPWIVLVEATIPGSQIESHLDWESLLTASEYVFVYADGLNRFYVANEHSHLIEAFKYPPNVFDGFRLSINVQLEQRIIATEKHIAELETQAEILKHKILSSENKYAKANESIKETAIIMARKESEFAERIEVTEEKLARWESRAVDLEREFAKKFEVQLILLEHRAIDAENKILRLRNSFSWRITYPFRKSLDFLNVTLLFFKKFINCCLCRFIEKFQKPISKLMRVVLGSSILSGWINGLILKYPAIHQHLLAIAMRHRVIALRVVAASEIAGVDQKVVLNSRASQIYNDLFNLKKK